jgi:hypothetical protein
MPHHDSVLSQRLNQRASTRATKYFFNEIGQKSDVVAFSGDACFTSDSVEKVSSSAL